MFDPETERWPPTYDANELAEQIKALAGTAGIESDFYAGAPVGSGAIASPAWCQGDVLWLDSNVPVLNESGRPATIESDSVWLLIGNTCDIDRSIEKVAWTQLMPMVDLGIGEEISAEELQALRSYTQFRRFYLPPWEVGGNHHVADLLRPVALHKAGLSSARRLARLSVRSWVLLHSCLVRFFARDDGRHDPT